MSGESLDRRALLHAAAAAAGAFGVGLVMGRALSVERTPAGGPPRSLSVREWETLEAVLAHLLPSDDLGPGAPEVNAIGYLDGVLADTRIPRHIAPTVRAAVPSLDQWARGRGALDFAGLGFDGRERALREHVATPEGLAWLRIVMGFVLEAFLGDPARGANPDGIGWTAVGHRPGWPRPTTPGWQPQERS